MREARENARDAYNGGGRRVKSFRTETTFSRSRETFSFRYNYTSMVNVSSTTVSFVSRGYMTDRREVRDRSFVFTTPLNTFRRVFGRTGVRRFADVPVITVAVVVLLLLMYRRDGAKRNGLRRSIVERKQQICDVTRSSAVS